MGFVFLDRDQVAALHDRALAAHGGLPGIRDENALRSAVQRPDDKAYYEPQSTLAEIAASLAFGLAKNHAFNDANKRTSLAATGVFLKLNGFRIDASGEEIFIVWVALADGSIAEDGLADWLAAHLAVSPAR